MLRLNICFTLIIFLQIPSEANPAGIIDFFPMFKAKVLPADYVIREGDT